MKKKIINILHHPPAYKAYRNSLRPEINWNTTDGAWIGIWSHDWPDVLGNEVLKLTGEFEYEVWQPDLRADKIYSHRFENGLVHKLFPAKYSTILYMYKFNKIIVSPVLVEVIKNEIKSRKIIIHINSSPLIYINNRIITKFKHNPILLSFHGNFPDYYKLADNKFSLKYIFRLFKKLSFKKILNNTNYITYQNEYQKNILFNLGISISKINFVTMGCYFDFWKLNNSRKIDKKNLKFLISSRFIPLKQIDKIIEIFNEIHKKYNFKLLIAGHGEYKYERYLKSISKNLVENNKLEFLGYLKSEEMLAAYNNCDYFLSTSTSEGCSVSVIKAFACDRGVFSTNVGGTAFILKKNNSGIIVDTYDYKQWKEEIVKILEGKEVPVLDREIAKEYFHWPNIAKKFVEIYKQLENELCPK